MNMAERAGRLMEFRRIPVSSQGQVTLPKAIRERLGVTAGGTQRITIFVKSDGIIVIEPEPTVNELFGILKTTTPTSPANIRELRGAMVNERIQGRGYDTKEQD
ncbi:AbrB/MazE/SpoVT family DNA-binding domain-containing protein [Sporomusa sphaeroides]|uniref:SpoVT / AbrB like domain protein n=2 Tax=Sporomusa TaxID=2375 RepID=A0ABP2C8K9_9FIRM|nr:AbrB/MazE/SpoVT family DNA-binding domain-containing protein [Sporomusa sphaeroides]OLS54394.1 SpoVT / AbrB like domain protein [Sporomusa sphaeroides DSM 2875]CVK20637.1 SpoVT / AbrB like domain protein [Sporomusa sphaeroides DSM 2875]SCM82823.1 Transcriptional regulator, AbrB family [uncultured Sporomusa sp.]HML33309.1 AbrB/MazE/SpoVT family DNA-binding domain-containing protein [Sporomusa sphaeroides]